MIYIRPKPVHGFKTVVTTSPSAKSLHVPDAVGRYKSPKALLAPDAKIHAIVVSSPRSPIIENIYQEKETSKYFKV